MQMPEPTPEHRWLQRLVGGWEWDSECPGEDGSPTKFSGSETVRSLGGLWTVGEGVHKGPDGETRTIMTLGFDPRIGRFVGTFLASCMTELWHYEGTLDAATDTLTLDCEGPDMMGGDPSKRIRYQDIITLHSEARRTLTSRIQGDDGAWTQFMTSEYRRTS